MNLQSIKIKNLEKSPLNARKTVSKAACHELKASILAHGLMQNLVVVPAKKNKFHVIAGARRLAALQALHAEGKLPDDYAVNCQVVSDESALEMSVAENTVRAAMHPADEFEAFAALVDQGQTTTQIAERFGVTEKKVQQRLKLGRVAPELLAEYRAGEIDLECLEAYTVTDDQKRQLAVSRSLPRWQKDNAGYIRRALTEKMTEADDKLAKFVGVEAYQAAGGRVKADLFGDDVYLEDTALLQRLAGEKLEAEAAKLRADGWGWVEVDFECGYGTLSKFGRLKPVPLDAPPELVAELKAAEAELKAAEVAWDEVDSDDDEAFESVCQRKDTAEEKVETLEGKLAAFTDFDPEAKKSAGCFVSIGWRGELAVEKGLVKPGDKHAVAKVESDDEEADEYAEPQKPGFPQSLVADLKAYRTQVAQFELAKNPDIAFDLLVFTVASDELGTGRLRSGLDVHFTNSYPKPSVGGETTASKRLEAVREALPLEWLKLGAEDERFHAFRALPEADKLRILAYCTALTVKPTLAVEGSACEAALALTGGSVAKYWRPTAANFLSRIKREQLLEVGREVLLGGDQWATRKKDAKKAALVAELDEAFGKSHLPDTTDKVKEWLPEGMSFKA